ncbi:MAG TPA: Rieske 2Fe-2S domain-containing protein [Acidimicrobiales bacterium]|nr:Rieske 2Fe-2S domain-containing protein [Acidimicrobiales bacterium]
MSEWDETHVAGDVEVTGPGDGAGDGAFPGATDANGDGRGVTLLPAVRSDEPHMQDAARHPGRVEVIVGLCFLIGILGVCAFGAAFVENADTQVLAGTLFVGLFFLGFGLAAWGKYLMPRGPFVEERHTMASSPRDRQAMAAALVERTGIVVKRRKVLGGLLGAGLGIFGIVAAFPLLRSLGPKPGSSLFRTNWKKGSLVVDLNGKPVHRTDMQVGGLLTVFPKGKEATLTAQAVDQTVLIRVQSANLVTMKGRGDWAPDGYVAYSKVCTHLGCPVGLYEQELELLVCPCHQSMFNVRNGAFPQFGPAPRPLPQLPVYFDSTGFLRAREGFDQPIGPGFWERTTEGNGKASAT